MRRLNHANWLAVIAILISGPLAAHGAAIVGETSDTDVRSDGTLSPTANTTLVSGAFGSPLYDRSSVLVFQLPNLGAVANPFTTASLRFNLASKTGTPPNLDLYGLGRRASSAVLAGDYYGQTSTADATDASLLQNNLLISTTANGPIYTNSGGATALKNHLNSQYASGAGAGQYVFLRLSSDTASTTAKSYTITPANAGTDGPRIIYNVPSGFTRPFIWVRDSEKADILAKISANPWATSVYNGMVSRVASDVASHQSNRDTFLRGLPAVDWNANPPKFKTIPAYSESSVRFPAEAKYNDALDCAVLYYLTGDAKYARCAADILHNAVKILLPVAASTSVGNGGWIFQDDLLKEARVTGTQLPIIYDFLYSWLGSNQVYDVDTAALVNFNFTNAQSVFRKQYELTRDHGQKESNWSSLMSTMMLNNLLALDNSTERNTALQIYLTTGTSRQASLQYDYRNYTETGNIWPESLQYAGAVGTIRSNHMVLLERVDPALNLFDAYPNLPLSLPRISYLRYPNGEQVMFGDGHRAGTNGPFYNYELIYQHALARGRTDLTSFFGSLINGGVADGKYNRSTLDDYSTLGTQTEPLQLLWNAASLSEPAVTPELPRTDKLPYAGITLQRNPAPSDNPTYGLMGFIGGAAHVHSHACGMSMELYGMGEVMGAKAGTESYGTTINENYYRVFASNNTVIVNGASRGEGGWGGFGINTVQTVAMEPQPFANAVSPSFSFTCSSFADDKGTQAEGTQQRTLSIIRTSPTTGYYVDVFRSKSTVANQFHDYIYRNIGETAVDLRANGTTLALTSQPSRFQTDIGDANEQPGWRYFENTMVSSATSLPVKAQFVATVSGTARYMDMHMPAVASREYAKVTSPPILEAPSPYSTKDAPALVVRQTGEAWNKAFATVFEPHYGSTGGTVQNVTQLVRSGIVVGVKVESTVSGKNLVQYIISNPAASETYTDSIVGLSFTGRFGIASNNGDGTTTLYLGEGSSLSYRGNSVATVSGSNSQAEARFTPGLAPVVTANTAVNTVVAPPPPNSTWVPTAAGSYNWNSTVNWNPAVIPNSEGYVANQNTNLAGNQTISLNSPTTLGELVIGDSSGGETTTLQKGTSGSLVLDQTDNANAYLTRTAGGTGTVALFSDLGISLTDNLTVRLAGGTSASNMLIAGTISGTGKGLTKDGGSLTLSLSGANTYTGETRVNAGILSLENSLALQNSTLDAANSATGDTTTGLKTTLASLTFGGLSGNKSLSSLFTTVSGGYSSVTNLTLNPGTGATQSYSGVIANGTAGMTLTKTGEGTQTLTGSNTYTGGTILAANSGTLEIGDAGRLGSGIYSGPISIGSGSIFEYSSSAAQQLNGSISGTGQLLKSISTSGLTLGASNSSFTGTIGLSNGTIILNHANALSGATAINLASGTSLKTSVQNATIGAAISVSGTPTIHAPDFGSGSTTSTLTLNGVISGSGNITFSSTSTVASNSNQTIRLNAQSTYSGSTTLNPADNDTNLIVKLGTTNALPATTVLSINGTAGGGSGRDADFDLNGFSQTIAGLQSTAASLRNQRVINGGAAAVLTINNSAARTFSGNINGTNLSLVKNGAGTQTLSSANSFTGATTITAGKLQGIVGGNCSGSSVTLANAAATLGVSITDNTKTWTCAALAASAAGTIEFDYGTILPGSVKSLTVTSLAAFTVAPVVRVVVNSSPAAGTYPLMSWGSTSGTIPSVVSVVKSNGSGGLADGTSATLSVSGNTLNLVVTVVPSFVKANNTNNLNLGTSWTGGVAPNATATSKWNNTVTAANTTVLGADTTWGGITIDNPGGAVTINAGHTLTLGANATDIGMSAATNNLTLNCPLVLGDDNDWLVTSGRTLTLGGIVSGAFPIVKEGAGTALLTASNTFTGEITLADNSGMFDIGGSGKLGGGTFAAAIAIGSGSTFRYNSTATQTLNSAISGAGTLTKSNTSTLTLGGDNSSFNGAVSLTAGDLVIGHANALSAATTIALSSGSELKTSVKNSTINAAITLGGTSTIHAPDFGTGSTVSTLTLNGAMSGSGNIVLSSASIVASNSQQTIRINVPGAYTGNTTLNPSDNDSNLIVKLGIDNALPATTVLSINGVAGGGSGRFARFDLNSFSQTIAGLQNTAATGRSQQILNTGNDSVTLTINNSASFTFSGNLNGSNLSLDKQGAGTQTLSGSNTFTGITSIGGGILSLGNSLAMQNSALDTSASITGDATNGLKTTVTTLTLGGLLGDRNLASVFTTAGGGYSGLTALTLNPGASITHEYSGVIANGAAGMTLTKTGPGTQILSGANTHSGVTTVSSGTLSLTGNRTDAATGGFSVGNVTGSTGTLDISNGTFAVGTTGSNFLVGNGTGSTGVLNQSGGSLTTIGNQLLVGNGTSTGIYNLNGGTLTTIAGSFGVTIGVNTGATATFNLSGTGTLTMPATSTLQICRSDNSAASGVTGTFSQTGGTATVGILQIGGSNTTPANNAGANATLSLSGGTFSATTFNTLSGADNSNSTINISGTADVTLPSFPTARGTGSTATINFNGGTLKPKAASTTYMGALNNAYIGNGGATIDTTNGSITISQALLADTVSTGGGLTKNGTNTLTLTGANTYTGDTTVNGGTLSLGAINAGNESSPITIAASGALLKLNFAGTDTVAKLFIGTSQKPAGTYGHSSTGATNGGLGVGAMDAFFAPGTGTLTVTGSSYAAWQALHAPTGTASDDFDNDKVANGIEYVLGGTASNNDLGKLPVIATNGPNIIFTFQRTRSSIDGITALSIEVGDNLGTWPDIYPVPAASTTNNPGVTVIKDSPGPGIDTVTLTLPRAPDTRKFVRLKVTP